jgi:hydrogenase-4 membrane subunit HyfE
MPIKSKVSSMFKILSFNFAINSMLIILSSVIVLHLLVLTQLIPYIVVGGGNLQNLGEMRRFEVTSVMIIALMIYVIAIKGQYVKSNVPPGIINVVLWIFFLLFIINTVGNMLAKSTLETIIFTPITIISSILCFRIVNERN